MNGHKESATGFLVIAASSIIVAISAVTTFGFFSTYFPGFVSGDLLGVENALWVSGLIGVIVFDLMTVVWLMTFLYRTETPEQRAVALIMTFTCFAFSAIASAAHLYLSASSFVVDSDTRQTIENAAVISVIAGVVLNFGAWIAYSRYSLESKDRVREADRRDMVQKAEDEQASYLDSLIAQKVKEKLKALSDELADTQAARIVDRFTDRELTKHADGIPTSQPARETSPAVTPSTPKRQSPSLGYNILCSKDGNDWQQIDTADELGETLRKVYMWNQRKDGKEFIAYFSIEDKRFKVYHQPGIDVPLPASGNGRYSPE